MEANISELLKHRAKLWKYYLIFLSFLGVGKEPQALTEPEVNRLLGISERDKSAPDTYDFYPGDIVKIVAGPFTDFEGTVDKISDDKKKLTVKVTVFGRATPVEVRIDQVEII